MFSDATQDIIGEKKDRISQSIDAVRDGMILIS